MQKKRDFKNKFIASLIVFMLAFSNFATLGSALVSYAADDSSDVINYSAQFVMITNTQDEEQTDQTEDTTTDVQVSTDEANSSADTVGSVEQNVVDEEQSQDDVENPVEDTTSENVVTEPDENTVDTEKDNMTDENVSNEVVTTDNTNDSTDEEQPVEEDTKDAQEEKATEGQKLQDGLAIEITLGVKSSGYLKNAKVDIKDLANQTFKLKDNISFGEYIQSIDESKIKLKQINGGTEIKVYIPIELKNEESIDMNKLQSGVELSLLGTYVDEEGNESIITKSTKPVLDISNDINLVVGSDVEKFIPYNKNGARQALVQIKVTVGTDTKNQLPVKDTNVEVELPAIDGAAIKDVNVTAISTGFTNGLLNGETLFTVENWSYENGKVFINVNNPEKNGEYKMNNGNDEYIISYTYEDYSDLTDGILKANVSAKSTVFTSTNTNEISNAIEKEYDLSQANSNIITYDVSRRTAEVSKGYLYANGNSNEPEYSIVYDNTFDINISRVDLVKTVQIAEGTEYFVDDYGNGYNTSTEQGENTYYKEIKLNKSNLQSIIGDTGSFELLREDGTSLIQINKDTNDDGDGYITIDFGESKIGKILMRINNPTGDGILNVVAKKAMTKTTYEKVDLTMFRGLEESFTGLAELEEGIVTEVGDKTVSTELTETSTGATLSLSRTDLSTLVDNEDIEINISLNNANATSDVYKNPVFELTFPKEIKNINIKDMNLLYGNDDLEIANVETLRDSEDRIVLKITLNGTQAQYTAGDSAKGTTVILNTDMKVDMYTASKNEAVIMNYYNEDATNYVIGSDWTMITPPSSYMLIGRQGTYDTELNIVAPEGLVNAQMVSNYKADSSLISVNQGRKEDSIIPFTDAKAAEMKMIVINNTDEELSDVHILGRTIFDGNKYIVSGEALGANTTAPMTSKIISETGGFTTTVYYSENGEATDDLEEPSNGWTVEPESLANVRSYLIVVNEVVKSGSILSFAYDFEIPANLTNNLDLIGTFGTYYTGTKTEGVVEADKVVLTTGNAPVLKVETVSDTDEASVVEGQHIKYTVRVTNEGRTVSADTVVNSIIPDGTTYVENGELRPDVTELKINLGDVAPGKTEEATYEVEVNKETADRTYIETNSNVEAEGLETPIYTTTESLPIQAAEINIELDANLQDRVIAENNTIEYTTHVVNVQGKDLSNVRVIQTIPENVDVVDAYVEEFNDDGLTTRRGANGIYDAQNRTVTWNVDKLEIFKTFKLTIRTNNISDLQSDLTTSSRVIANGLTKEYVSNEVKNTLGRPQIEATYYSTNDNRYVKEGDIVQYVLKLKNTGTAEATQIDLKNEMPSEFRVTSVECNKEGYVFSALSSENPTLTLNLGVGETAEVVLNCTAQNLSNVVDETLAENKWNIGGTNLSVVSTNKIENIIQQSPDVTNNTYEEIIIGTNNEEKETTEDIVVVNGTSKEAQKSEVQISNNVYRIIGKAFVDMNKNGQRDDDEEGMANVVAVLCDAATQDVVGQTVTNNVGEYIFENVTPGEYYVRFEYDSSKYTVTDYKKQGVNSDRNSDAIVSNYKAVTDKIKVTDTSISDIDIGLVRAGIFDLSLDANLNKVTVQNDEGANTYEMENPKLAKIDINPKYVNSSKIFAEYTISVTNRGEISGYAKSIVDYLPEGLELDTSMNNGWYVGLDGNAYTNQLEDILIQPGETKEIKLILTKQMTENGNGIINNTFEIAETYNEYAIEDIDSTPGNQAQDEDDMSKVDLIIGIQTGGSMINLMIISTTLITVLIALYVIKIQIDKKNKEVIV